MDYRDTDLILVSRPSQEPGVLFREIKSALQGFVVNICQKTEEELRFTVLSAGQHLNFTVLGPSIPH